jgi:hypothetical protein
MIQLAIRPTAVMVYSKKPKGIKQRTVQQESLDNLQGKYGGKGMSDSARARIKRIIANWNIAVHASQRIWQHGQGVKRRYFVMMTLTLPSRQIESDNDVKRLYLNNWLRKLHYNYPKMNYLWAAETQANGNIHFHVIGDHWIDKRWVQQTWNETLENGQYIDLFAAKFGHRNPPSTKVTGQKSMKDPALYITKYISKEEGRRPVDGHCWYCCDALKSIACVGLPQGDVIENELLKLFAAMVKQTYCGSHSKAYYFNEPLCRNGVLDFIFDNFPTMVCRCFMGFYSELQLDSEGDLPLEISPMWLD